MVAPRPAGQHGTQASPMVHKQMHLFCAYAGMWESWRMSPAMAVRSSRHARTCCTEQCHTEVVLRAHARLVMEQCTCTLKWNSACAPCHEAAQAHFELEQHMPPCSRKVVQGTCALQANTPFLKWNANVSVHTLYWKSWLKACWTSKV